MIETQIVDSDFILVISGVRNSVGSFECAAEMICDVHESNKSILSKILMQRKYELRKLRKHTIDLKPVQLFGSIWIL